MIRTLKASLSFRAVAVLMITSFIAAIPSQSGWAQVAGLPAPGTALTLSAPIEPPVLAGLRVDASDPFSLSFIVDRGGRDLPSAIKRSEYDKLIRFFLAALTTPNRDMWVNLSPYEKERILPEDFARTDMGRELLEQDYLLKQLTASLMAPDASAGREFWQRVYARAQHSLGTTDVALSGQRGSAESLASAKGIPAEAFSKVWITADKAEVYQKGDTVLLTASHLKVQMESDFLAERLDRNGTRPWQEPGTSRSPSDGAALRPSQGFGTPRSPSDGAALRDDVKAAMRSVIIPIIEKEVNEGTTFARLRQIYSAMILATWYKKALKDSLLERIYADRSRVAGVAVLDEQAKQKIYEQYLAAYRKGVVDEVREEVDPLTQEIVPRKYFSGGVSAPQTFGIADAAEAVRTVREKGMRFETARVTLRVAGTALAASLALSSPASADAVKGWPSLFRTISTSNFEHRPVARVPGGAESLLGEINPLIGEVYGLVGDLERMSLPADAKRKRQASINALVDLEEQLTRLRTEVQAFQGKIELKGALPAELRQRFEELQQKTRATIEQVRQDHRMPSPGDMSGRKKRARSISFNLPVFDIISPAQAMAAMKISNAQAFDMEIRMRRLEREIVHLRASYGRDDKAQATGTSRSVWQAWQLAGREAFLEQFRRGQRELPAFLAGQGSGSGRIRELLTKVMALETRLRAMESSGRAGRYTEAIALAHNLSEDIRQRLGLERVRWQDGMNRFHADVVDARVGSGDIGWSALAKSWSGEVARDLRAILAIHDNIYASLQGAFQHAAVGQPADVLKDALRRLYADVSWRISRLGDDLTLQREVKLLGDILDYVKDNAQNDGKDSRFSWLTSWLGQRPDRQGTGITPAGTPQPATVAAKRYQLVQLLPKSSGEADPFATNQEAYHLFRDIFPSLNRADTLLLGIRLLRRLLTDGALQGQVVSLLGQLIVSCDAGVEVIGRAREPERKIQEGRQKLLDLRERFRRMQQEISADDRVFISDLTNGLVDDQRWSVIAGHLADRAQVFARPDPQVLLAQAKELRYRRYDIDLLPELYQRMHAVRADLARLQSVAPESAAYGAAADDLRTTYVALRYFCEQKKIDVIMPRDRWTRVMAGMLLEGLTAWVGNVLKSAPYQTSLVTRDLEAIAAIGDELYRDPVAKGQNYPARVAMLKVTRARELRTIYRSAGDLIEMFAPALNGIPVDRQEVERDMARRFASLSDYDYSLDRVRRTDREGSVLGNSTTETRLLTYHRMLVLDAQLRQALSRAADKDVSLAAYDRLRGHIRRKMRRVVFTSELPLIIPEAFQPHEDGARLLAMSERVGEAYLRGELMPSLRQTLADFIVQTDRLRQDSDGRSWSGRYDYRKWQPRVKLLMAALQLGDEGESRLPSAVRGEWRRLTDEMSAALSDALSARPNGDRAQLYVIEGDHMILEDLRNGRSINAIINAIRRDHVLALSLEGRYSRLIRSGQGQDLQLFKETRSAYFLLRRSLRSATTRHLPPPMSEVSDWPQAVQDLLSVHRGLLLERMERVLELVEMYQQVRDVIIFRTALEGQPGGVRFYRRVGSEVVVHGSVMINGSKLVEMEKQHLNNRLENITDSLDNVRKFFSNGLDGTYYLAEDAPRTMNIKARQARFLSGPVDGAGAPGGIDLNGERLKITVRAPLVPRTMQLLKDDPDLVNIPGLEPVIRSIQPATPEIIPLLGELR